MKMLTKSDQRDIALWMRRNARELELTRYRALMEGGDRAAIARALTDYQNPDGGFGNALEPDNFNPFSTPYTTANALVVLRQDGIHLKKEHPIVAGILRYLESCTDGDEDSWYFTVPSNDGYAHAPWWNYSMEENKVQSLGISVTFALFLLEYAEKGSALYKKAERVIAGGEKRLGGELGDMGLVGLCALSEHLGRYQDEVKAMVDASIERDTSKWPWYVRRPSDYIDGPQSPYYKGNEEITEAELDYYIETRAAGDVWPITWQWYDNYEKYPKAFGVGENWWKGIKAVEHLLFLKAFGRVE